jgi:hypothetical protein
LELDTLNALASLKFQGFETLKILQIVSASSNEGFSTPSTEFVDSPVKVTITPKTNASKILLLVSGTAGSGSTGAYFTIVRNEITNMGDSAGLLALARSNPVESIFMMAYDSPATIAPVTYNVKIKCDGGTGTAFPTTALPPLSGQPPSTKGYIFAIEIAP